MERSSKDTVIDGELVALGPDGRPDFNRLQNFRSAELRMIYYAFDILMHQGRRLTELPLLERRAILINGKPTTGFDGFECFGPIGRFYPREAVGFVNPGRLSAMNLAR
jgi:hypothetical protein